MSEISKERVEALASSILECHDVKPSEVKALAALALLALRERAEPVTVSLKLAKLFRKITNSEIDAEGNAHVILSPNETLTIIEARRALTAPPVPVEPGWIACSERMPELDTRVLLYFPDYGGHIEDGCIGDEGDGPYHYFFDGDSLRHEPTHWMPLPEAPGKEE